MKQYIAIILLIFLSACAEEIEVKPEKVDPYAGDPAGEASKERGITIK